MVARWFDGFWIAGAVVFWGVLFGWVLGSGVGKRLERARTVVSFGGIVLFFLVEF